MKQEKWHTPDSFKPNAPNRGMDRSRNDACELIRYDDPMMDEANEPLPGYFEEPYNKIV